MSYFMHRAEWVYGRHVPEVCLSQECEVADAKTGEAGRRAEHPPHSYATRLQSQAVSEKSFRGAKIKVSVQPNIATVETIVSYPQRTEERQPKQVRIPEEKEQMELKPQHYMPGEHSIVHSDMSFPTAFSPET